MTVEQFQKTLKRQPFRPFTIRVADGQSFEVRHPDFVAQSPTGRTISVFGNDDACSILDMLLITELRDHASEGTHRDTNGEP